MIKDPASLLFGARQGVQGDDHHLGGNVQPGFEELPDLEEINGRLAGKDCAIVGLLYDGFDPDAVAAAKEIMESAGVTYTMILPPENADDLFIVDGFPTSFFVNREGVVVGEPVVGKMVDIYEPAIDSLLSAGTADMEKPAGVTARGVGGKSLADKGVSANDAGMYRIIVLDEKGRREAAEIILSEGQRLQALSYKLLELSSLESKGITPEDINTSEMADDIIKTVGGRINETKLDVNLEDGYQNSLIL